MPVSRDFELIFFDRFHENDITNHSVVLKINSRNRLFKMVFFEREKTHRRKPHG